MRLNISLRRRVAMAVTLLVLFVVAPATGGMLFSLTNSQAIRVSQVSLEGRDAINGVASGLTNLVEEIDGLLQSRDLEASYQIESTLQSLNLAIDVLANTTLGIPVSYTHLRAHEPY